MTARDHDSHGRKVLIGGVIALLCVIFALGVYKYHAWMHQTGPSRSNDREFNQNRHNSFLEQLEIRDKIHEPAEHEREKAENTVRYEQLKGTPQVVWGSLVPPAGKKLGNRLRMSLRRKGPEKPVRWAKKQTVVDDELHFAFAATEPGVYDLVLYETSACPGVRVENVTVAEGLPIPEMIVNVEDASVAVTVWDAKGNVVPGSQVTVGKSSGGTNGDLYTWRKGLTDPNGLFLAENITDGQYVISVYTLSRNGGAVIPVARNQYQEAHVTLTHDNY